jgi:hypothetical protein
MAGLGAKLFTAFSKLTAAQVNGYLMDQSIMRFASTAARDAAFGGAGEPTLAEGMTCYLDDTNVLQSYTGSAWVTITSSASPPSLELISTITCSAGGTAANGVVTVGSGVSSVVIGNAFSSSYQDYRIIYSGGVANGSIYMAFTLSGASTAYFGSLFGSAYATGAFIGLGVNSAANWSYAGLATLNYTMLDCDIYMPNMARSTLINSKWSFNLSSTGYSTFTGEQASNTQHTGFTITPTGGVLTGGTIRVYGYRNQL